MMMVSAAIPVAMAKAGSEVSLVIPPAPAMVEEGRETRLPASPGGGMHGSPSWSELSGSGGDVARSEVEQPPAGREVEEVEIPYLGKVGTKVEPPAILPSQELVVVPVIGWAFQRVGGDHRPGVALPWRPKEGGVHPSGCGGGVALGHA